LKYVAERCQNTEEYGRIWKDLGLAKETQIIWKDLGLAKETQRGKKWEKYKTWDYFLCFVY